MAISQSLPVGGDGGVGAVLRNSFLSALGTVLRDGRPALTRAPRPAGGTPGQAQTATQDRGAAMKKYCYRAASPEERRGRSFFRSSPRGRPVEKSFPLLGRVRHALVIDRTHLLEERGQRSAQVRASWWTDLAVVPSRPP